MTRTFMTALALAASVAAAPLAAEQVKPVQPKTSTQAAAALGGLSAGQALVVTVAIAGVAAAVATEGGSTSQTPAE